MGTVDVLKYTMVIMNAIIVMIGISVFGLGLYLHITQDSIGPFLLLAGINEHTLSIVLYIDGLFCIGLGTVGINGALRTDKSTSVFYASVLTVVFIVLIIAAGLIYGLRSKFHSSIEEGMIKSLPRYNSSLIADTVAWDAVQKQIQCCGIRNFTDYNSLTNWNSMNGTHFPRSCCLNEPMNCDVSAVNKMGCHDGTLQHLISKWHTWGGVCIGIAVCLLIAISISFFFLKALSAYGQF